MQLRLFRNDNFIKYHTRTQNLVIPACNIAKSLITSNMFSPVFNSYKDYYAIDYILALGFGN